MESILDTTKGVCFLCGRHCQTHKHHVFGGPNRWRSERDGLTLYLCPECHRTVHSDFRYAKGLRMIAETEWLTTRGAKIADFIAEYGKNYLEVWHE